MGYVSHILNESPNRVGFEFDDFLAAHVLVWRFSYVIFTLFIWKV